MNEKYGYFIKNFAVLSLGKVSTKLIVFFMIPIYTSVLHAEEYGIFDFVNTIISISLPIFTINIQTAVTKFVLTDKKNPTNVLLVSTRIFIYSLLFFFILLSLNYFLEVSIILKDYMLEIMLLYIFSGYLEILSEHARAIDKMVDLTKGSILSTFTNVFTNIITLVILKWGLIGFFYANILGPASGVFYLIYKHRILSALFTTSWDDELCKKMLAFSYPMVFNSLSWWVNGAADRYIIIAFCGLHENGLYALSYKLIAAFDMIQNIFNQAWCVSALKEFDNNDKENFFMDIYQNYLLFMVSVCMFFFLVLDFLSKMLFSGDFVNSWIYVPFLTIAALFGGLSGFIGVIFSAVNKTHVFAATTILGGGVNVLLNFILVPYNGAIGAAIASLCSYLCVFLFRAYIAGKYVKISWIDTRMILCFIVLLFQALVLLNIEHCYAMYVFLICSDCFIIYLFRFSIFIVYRKLKMNFF